MVGYFAKYNWIVPVGLMGLSFMFFQLCYPYHLLLKEQIQLFLYTPDYFLSYFKKPAWMASYVGDFLTQFFYLRGGGAVVLASLFGVEWLLGTVVIKRIAGVANAGLWASFPVLADWILHCDTLHGVSVSVGFILVMSLFLIYSLTAKKWLSYLVLAIFTVSGYWLAGVAFLAFPFLVVAYDFSQQKSSWLKGLLVFATVFSIPVMWRHHYLLTQIHSFIFPAFNKQSLFLPVALLGSVTCAFLLKKLELTHPKMIGIGVSFSLFVVLATGLKANANFNFEKILSLDYETYLGNPERVVGLAKKYQLKNKQASYFTNMALARQGVLPEYLLHFYQPFSLGLILPVTPNENWQSIFVSNEVFFLMGDMNLAQHSAMLGNTFSPYQRSSRMMRRLAEINLVNEDSAAANKYLRILSKTQFHKKWAQSRLAINHSPNTARWLAEKRTQLPRTDRLIKSNDYLAALSFLVEQNPGNLIALDYLLCYHLLNKDLKSFRNVYDQYARSVNRPVPAVYGEALLIGLFTSRASSAEALVYAIRPEKLKDFTDYTELYEKTAGDSNALKGRFGRSYWFYYHFATIQKK